MVLVLMVDMMIKVMVAMVDLMIKVMVAMVVVMLNDNECFGDIKIDF